MPQTRTSEKNKVCEKPKLCECCWCIKRYIFFVGTRSYCSLSISSFGCVRCMCALLFWHNDDFAVTSNSRRIYTLRSARISSKEAFGRSLFVLYVVLNDSWKEANSREHSNPAIKLAIRLNRIRVYAWVYANAYLRSSEPAVRKPWRKSAAGSISRWITKANKNRCNVMNSPIV